MRFFFVWKNCWGEVGNYCKKNRINKEAKKKHISNLLHNSCIFIPKIHCNELHYIKYKVYEIRLDL